MNPNRYWKQSIKLHLWKWLAYGNGDVGLQKFFETEAYTLRSKNRSKGDDLT